MVYLVEPPAQNIPHLNIRVFCKQRGIGKRHEDMTGGGVLLAERTEGIATVAHARPWRPPGSRCTRKTCCGW
jgi:hypothetical protein